MRKFQKISTGNKFMSTAIYTHPACLLHEMGAGHPECPERLIAIDSELGASPIFGQLLHRQAALATEQQLTLVHSDAHIHRIKHNSPAHGYYELDGDTTLNPSSWTAGLAAAGAAIAATDAVIDGQVNNAFCAIRPPGHHATPTAAMGFCLFNNIALAAQHALTNRRLERVALIDFDVHHGNGTQAAFEGDERVLMVSFFQHPLYPYSGTESAGDNMLNIPVPAHTNGATIRKLVAEHWLPALHRFQPQMIFISAGFDAHRDDIIGQMRLVEDDYLWMTRHIQRIAALYSQGRIVSCLEGGYNTTALALSVLAHLRGLLENGQALHSDAK
jgi:acetoin utilization deacetylase AcuC-like enzyme